MKYQYIYMSKSWNNTADNDGVDLLGQFLLQKKKKYEFIRTLRVLKHFWNTFPSVLTGNILEELKNHDDK